MSLATTTRVLTVASVPRDLGTAVLAPTCGFYADQGPVHGYHLDEHGFDEDSLVRALTEAYEAGPPPPVTMAERRRQRQQVADAHACLYRSLA